MMYLLVLLLLSTYLIEIISTNPVLTGFVFDSGNRKMTFTFDQIIHPPSFNFSDLSLQPVSNLNGSTTTFSFNQGLSNPSDNILLPSAQSDSTSFYLNVIMTDFFDLLTSGVLPAPSTDKVFVTLGEHAIANPAGEFNQIISNSSAFEATSMLMDTDKPTIDAFDLDMGTGILSINFSEPVDVSSFTLAGVRLQSLQSINTLGSTNTILGEAGADVPVPSNRDRQLDINLGNTNLNLIKRVSGLAVDQSSTFLSMVATVPMVKDKSGNDINIQDTIFYDINAGRVRNYGVDNSPPTLVSWEFDYNTESLTLVFSETVAVAFIKYDFFQIISESNNQSLSITIETPTVPPTENTDIVIVNINTNQLNTIKDTPGILKALDNSYLVVQEKAVEDTAPLKNKYSGNDATLASPMQASVLNLDTTDPKLVGYSLNMTSKLLQLSFSETIDMQSFDVGRITLQSAAVGDDIQGIALSALYTNVLTTSNAVVVTIELLDEIFGEIKLLEALAVNKDTSYISFPATLLRDVAPNGGNQIEALLGEKAQKAASFIPDYIPPSVTTWAVNMSINILTLTISEPLNVTTIALNQLTLMSDSELLPSTQVYALTSSSVIKTQTLSSLIITIGDLDMNRIKTKPPLCQSTSRCYLTHTSAFATDTSTYTDAIPRDEIKNNITALAPVQGSFGADVRPPVIKSWSLDMSLGLITLLFSEPVDYFNMNCNGITLHSSANPTIMTSYNHVNLSSFTFSNGSDLALVYVTLTNDDLNLIKLSDLTLSDSYLKADDFTVRDIAGNKLGGLKTLGALESQAPLQATEVIADSVKPNIVGYKLIRESSSDTDPVFAFIYFDDVISLKTNEIEASKLEIKASSDAVAFGGALSDAAIMTNTSRKVSTFLQYNLTTITFLQHIIDFGLASSYAQCYGGSTCSYIHAKSRAVQDIAFEPNSIATLASGFREGNTVLSFRMLLNKELMIIEFGFSWNLSYVDLRQFTIKSTKNTAFYTTLKNPNGATSISFNATLDGSDGKKVVTLDLSNAMNDIQSTFAGGLASTRDDIILEIGRDGAADYSGLRLSYATQTVNCLQITTDVTQPQLISFDLDLAKGRMTVVFDEPVNTSTVLTSKFALQNRNGSALYGDTVRIYLTQSTLIDEGVSSSATLNFDLTSGDFPADRDRIHLSATVGVNLASTWLFVTEGSVRDVSVPANFFASTEPVSVTLLTQDEGAPKLFNYELNLNTYELLMRFDEVIRVSSADPSKLMFVQEPTTNQVTRYTLQNSTVVTTGVLDDSAESIVVKISKLDIDNIWLLSPDFLDQKRYTYLSIGANMIRDIGSLQNPISDEYGPQYARSPFKYTGDTIPPVLVSFDFFISNRTIDMYFDSVINCPATDISKFIFQMRQGTPSEFMSLTTASSSVYCALDYQKTLRINIGLDDLLIIKTNDYLAKSSSQTWVRMEEGAFSDASGNPNKKKGDGLAIRVTRYTPDVIPPTLLSFTVLISQSIVLTFSEPMNKESLVLSRLIMQEEMDDGTNSNNILTYALSESELGSASYDKTQLTIVLNTDFTQIKANSLIFNTQENTNIRAENNLITDTSGNALAAIDATKALALGPSISNFDLDMDRSLIRLYFSEPVNQTFSLKDLIIQPYGNDNTACITRESVRCVKLTSTSVAVAFGSSTTIFNLDISSEDLNNIKFNGLGNVIENTFLSAYFGLTNSLSDTTIIPRLKTTEVRMYQALPVRDLITDSSPPVCQGFGLDLTNQFFDIFFDETVQINSLDVSGITLLPKSTGTALTLSGSLSISLVNQTIVRLELTKSDFNIIKKLEYLSTSGGGVNNLLMIEGVILDFAGNAYAGNVGNDRRVRTAFVPDKTAPSITTYSLNMETSIFTIEFSETILVSSIELKNIFLSETSDITQGNITLAAAIILEKSPGIVTIDLGLYVTDSVAMRETRIGTDLNTTFLTIVGVEDLFGNVGTGTTVRATSITPNQANPNLDAFELIPDAPTSGKSTIIMYFDQPMNVTAFNCSDFIFQNRFLTSSSDIESFSLSYSDCDLSSNTDTKAFDISIEIDTSKIISDDFKSSREKQFLRVKSSDISSVAQNGLSFVTFDDSTSIRVGPRIVSYLLDMNSGNLSLVFNEDMDISLNFTANSVALAGKQLNTRHFLSNDTKAYDINGNKRLWNLQIPPQDLMIIKAFDISESSVRLTSSSLITSSRGNTFTSSPIEDGYGISSSQFIPDITAPTLLSFSLDMSSNIIVLNFDEPMRAPSIGKLSSISIQFKQDNNTFDYALTGAKTAPITNLNSITIELSRTDSFKIKLNESFATSINNTFLAIAFTTLEDMAGAYLEPVENTNAFQATTFVEDSVNPILDSYTINMDSGLITLNFDEPVRTSPEFDLSSITLQDRFRSRSLTLSDGTVQAISLNLVGESIVAPDNQPAENSEIQVIKLTAASIEAIKYIPNLARSLATTWLQVASSAAMDMNRNPMIAIPDGSAKLVSSFTSDATQPTIDSFAGIDFDANAGIISFTFDEYMIKSMTDPLQVTIHKDNTGSGTSYDLTSVSAPITSTDRPFTKTLQVKLGEYDLNNLKYRYPLASSIEYTYITLKSTFSRDVYNNPIIPVEITNINAQIKSYVKDVTPPTLLTYTLDMSTNIMSLVFSEAVKPSSIDFSQIFMQNTAVARFGFRTNLVGSSVDFGINELSTNAFITIGTSIVANMKRNGVGLNKTVTLLSFTDQFITDHAGNFAPPQWDAGIEGYQPLQASVFTKDTVAPALVEWLFDRPAKQFYITFSEPVSLLDGSLFEIFVGDDISLFESNPAYIALTDAVGTRVEGSNTIIIDIPIECVIIATDGGCSRDKLDILASKTEKLWLAIAAGAVKDFSELSSINVPTTVLEPKAEGVPDCSPCPTGFYASKLCTSNEDRVCSACTICGAGSYESVPCSQTLDTRCAICDSCPVGTYISGTCSGTNDVTCSYCTRCKATEYESVPCNGVSDTVCESCTPSGSGMCTFNSEAARIQCEAKGQYLFYVMNNCCKDEYTQKVVPCNTLENARMEASSRRGTHHWVFPDTSPQITGCDFPNHCLTP